MLAEAGCVSRRMKVEWSIYKYISVAVQKMRVSVEPRLMDTPQQWTSTIQWKIPKVLTILLFTSILKQALNSRHPATPYNGQFSWSQLCAVNT